MEQFRYQEWSDFGSLETIGRKAGVTQDKLGLVVAKELVDNALDACGDCAVSFTNDGGGFYVRDDGPGIDGPMSKSRNWFSIGRPL